MSILSIEDTIIDGTRVTVTAVVDNMRLLYRANRFEPEEWAPALCQATVELDQEESLPFDENGFCNYLDDLEPQWQILDTSDYDF
jgi:hypothetical protein